MRKVFCLCFLLWVAKPCFAYDFENNGVYYTISSIEDKTVYVDQGDIPYSGNIKIPSSVIFKDKEMKVTGISGAAFYNTNIVSIEISEGISEIRENCFTDCKSLNSVSLPNTIKIIGYRAFEGCTSLTKINLPNSLTDIGTGAFSGCTNLQNIVIPPLIKEIKDATFWGCDNLKVLKIPNNVNKVGPYIIKSVNILEFEEGDDPLYCRNGNKDDRASGLVDIHFFGSFSNSSISKLIIGRHFDYKKEKEERSPFYWDYFEAPFYKCESIKSIVIRNNVKEIPSLNYSNIDTVVCESPIPIDISENTFSHKTYVDGILYVPTGSKKNYESKPYWKNFFSIEEIPSSSDITNIQTITFKIQNEGGKLTINGLNDNTKIFVYSIIGFEIASAISRKGSAVINTNLCPGSIAIIKIGNNSTKFVIR